MNNLPKNEAEFNLLMEEINAKLQEKNIPMVGRPIGALREVCKKFDISLNIAPLSTPAIPDVYEGDSLSSHIYDWFDDKYGNRVKIGYLGSTVILIRGDPWRIRMPIIYGFHFVCDRDITKEIITQRTAISSCNKVINLLYYIEDLTPDLAQELSDAELRDIADFFILSYSALSRMRQICRKKPLLDHAKMDLESSVNHIFSSLAGYGSSKWSSLQCIEKILKAYIDMKGGEYKRIHDLNRLMHQASQLGAVALPQQDILSIQCSPGVRYGDPPVSLQEAIDAHQAAVRGVAKMSGQIIC